MNIRGVLRTVSPAGGKKAGYADSLSAEKMVAKSDPRLGFRAVLTAPLRWQCGCKLNWRNRGSRAGGYPFASWQHYARRCAGGTLGCQAIVGLSDEDLHRLSHSRCAISTTIIWCRKPATGAICVAQSATHQSAGNRNRSGAVFITRSFEVLRPDILQALNRFPARST